MLPYNTRHSNRVASKPLPSGDQDSNQELFYIRPNAAKILNWVYCYSVTGEYLITCLQSWENDNYISLS